ncbi:unnamed protein product, partial [marine sediment metagenome]
MLQLIIAFSFAIVVLVLVAGFISINYEDEERNAYWKCHEEEVIEKLENYWDDYQNNKCYPLNSEIICEKGL